MRITLLVPPASLPAAPPEPRSMSIQVAQPNLGLRIALLRRLLVPSASLPDTLLEPLPPGVQVAQLNLGLHIALLRRPAIPFGRLSGIPSHAPAVERIWGKNSNTSISK